MKFKVKPGSETFKKLMELRKKVESANEQARNFAKKIGGTAHCKDQDKIAGGIEAVQFDNKPEGWKTVGEKYQRLYFPKSIPANKKLLAEIAALPTIPREEINSILGYNGFEIVAEGRGLAVYHTLPLSWNDKMVLINCPNDLKYKPPGDLVEILESEYSKLLKKIEKEEEEEVAA